MTKPRTWKKQRQFNLTQARKKALMTLKRRHQKEFAKLYLDELKRLGEPPPGTFIWLDR